MTNKDAIAKKARYYLSCHQEGQDIYSNQEFLSWLSFENNKKIFEEEKAFRQMFLNISKEDKKSLSEQVQKELKQEKFLSKIKKMTTLAACFFVVGFVYIFYFKDNYSQNIYSQNKIVQDILMPDDSKITLDAKTSLKVEYTKDKREIFLEKGKAIFEVSSNVQRPFYVRSNDISIKVVGTKFEVNQKSDRVDISVLDGIVDINHKDLKVSELKKGDILEISNSGELKNLRKSSVEKMASWENGKLIFNQTPLFDVLTEFSKYVGKDMDLIVSKKDEFPITGEFNIDEFDKFVKLLPMIYPIKVQYVGDKKVVFRN